MSALEKLEKLAGKKAGLVAAYKKGVEAQRAGASGGGDRGHWLAVRGGSLVGARGNYHPSQRVRSGGDMLTPPWIVGNKDWATTNRDTLNKILLTNRRKRGLRDPTEVAERRKRILEAIKKRKKQWMP